MNHDWTPFPSLHLKPRSQAAIEQLACTVVTPHSGCETINIIAPHPRVALLLRRYAAYQNGCYQKPNKWTPHCCRVASGIENTLPRTERD